MDIAYGIRVFFVGQSRIGQLDLAGKELRTEASIVEQRMWTI